MGTEGLVIIVGMGQVGRPLAQILSRTFRCANVDVEPVEINEPCSVLHLCIPFQIEDFLGTTLDYIEKYQPALLIVNSTVAPGTTRKIYEASGHAPVAYSPVRGKHARMVDDLLRYRKFVAGCDDRVTGEAVHHFGLAGFRTDTFRNPEIAELGKLLETTYLGVLTGWAQEVERLAAQYGATFDEVNAFVKEIDFLPSHIFPGHIGGHCVMPNIKILLQQFKSQFLVAVLESNCRKQRELEGLSEKDAE